MKTFFTIICCLISANLFAQRPGQTPVPDSVGYAAIERTRELFPKFYREFKDIKAKDGLIKGFRFIEQKGIGPAFATPNGIITLNIDFINNPKQNFDDNRLIVILYHEVGHLHYYINTPRPKFSPIASEKAAFEYSLLKTKELAEKGDCLPLASGVKFMKLRSMGRDLNDPHIPALKLMVSEPLYADYVKYVKEKCGG